MNAITLPNFKSVSYEIYDDTDILIEKSIEPLPIKEQNIKITEPNEQLGKMFEMAICLLYDIPYDGGYKYISEANKENTEKMKDRIVKLLELFPMCKHSAKCGSPYDYTAVENSELHLSAKTTQKDGKICPQVIGQPSRKKFCEYFKLDSNNKTVEEINGLIKQYIQDNIFELLREYFSHTFDCPMIYYNKKADIVQFITCKQLIEWSTISSLSFSHIKKNKLWNESSCICIEKNGKLITLGEFQVHNHRDCIKFRWCFKVLLTEFAEYFNITAI